MGRAEMLNAIFRHYRARARLKARKERAERLRSEMCNTWEIKRRWSGAWYTNAGKPNELHVGSWVVVGETNMLGDRRLRTVLNKAIRNQRLGEEEGPLCILREYDEMKQWEAGLDVGTSGEIKEPGDA